MNKIAQVFGNVEPPPGVKKYSQGEIGGLSIFINNLLKLLIVGAGIYALFNLVLAGYAFMSSGDDPQKKAAAWAKIWQTMMGLAFAAGAFVLAAIFGKIIFDDAGALLNLKIFGPTPSLP